MHETRDKTKNDLQATYITGIGLVTPVGVGRKKFWDSLLANESGAGPITLFDPEGFDVKIAAECTDFEPRDFMDRKAAQRMDRFAQFAIASTLMALNDAGAEEFLRRHPERVGSVIGTGIGGVMSRERTRWEMDNKGFDRVSPFALTKIMANAGAAQSSLQLGIQGPSISPALACSCGTDAMGMGYDLIRRGDADMVLCGASDAKITGIGRTTDAYNLTDPDPKGRGITRAMTLAVESAGLQPEQIGYINPHGAGTVAGDGPESWAMHFINPRVRVSATKSNLGHSMGATGAIETAICALALKERVVPPMRNLDTLAEDCAPLDYVVGEAFPVPELEAAICVNLAVGGHNVAITLECV